MKFSGGPYSFSSVTTGIWYSTPTYRVTSSPSPRRRRDAESAYDDRSHCGDDEQSYDFACVLFHFAFLLCNNGFCSLDDRETYRSSCDTIIMHILALVTVTSVSCFAETKKSSGEFPEESNHFVSWSVVTTSLFSIAVAISSSLLLKPPFSIMSEMFHLTPLTDRPNLSAISR